MDDNENQKAGWDRLGSMYSYRGRGGEGRAEKGRAGPDPGTEF